MLRPIHLRFVGPADGLFDSMLFESHSKVRWARLLQKAAQTFFMS